MEEKRRKFKMEQEDEDRMEIILMLEEMNAHQLRRTKLFMRGIFASKKKT